MDFRVDDYPSLNSQDCNGVYMGGITGINCYTRSVLTLVTKLVKDKQ